MKRIFLFLMGLTLCLGASAQVQEASDTLAAKDSCVFDKMPGYIVINQSQEVKDQLPSHIYDGADAQKEAYKAQKSRRGTQFRIRIYSESTQNARAESSNAMARFEALYPGVAVYRKFSSPFFNVTAGDFSTRGEADAALAKIRQHFPKACIVME